MVNVISFLLFLATTVFWMSLNVDLSFLYNLPSLASIILTPILLCTFAFGKSGLRFWKSLVFCIFSGRTLETQEISIAEKAIIFTYGAAAFYTVMPFISVLLAFEGQAVDWPAFRSAMSVLLLVPMYALILSEFIVRPVRFKSENSSS